MTTTTITDHHHPLPVSRVDFLAFYVLAPEKSVALAAFEKGGLDNGVLAALIVLGGMSLDLCGVGALVAGLAGPVLPAALAVGYAATALGGLGVIGMAILDN